MIRVGLIGYGRWGPNLARCVAADLDCELSAICDLASGRLAEAARAHPAATLTNDWRVVAADPRIDAIVVAAPVAWHFEIGRVALELGKHVLIEKPIARSAEEVLALIEVAESKRLVLMTDHTYLYNPAVRAIAKLLRSGALGKIRQFDSVRTNTETADRDVNVLWDLASHDLSVIDFLFDAPPRAISAIGARCASGEQTSGAAMCVYFPGDVIARIRVDWFAPAKVRRLEIAGSEEKLIFDDLQPEAKLKLLGNSAGKAGGDGASIVAIEQDEPLGAAVRHFAACIQYGRSPLSDGVAGLRVVRLLEAAQRSVAERGCMVEVNAQ
jgi:predicted dehydrogenase